MQVLRSRERWKPRRECSCWASFWQLVYWAENKLLRSGFVCGGWLMLMKNLNGCPCWTVVLMGTLLWIYRIKPPPLIFLRSGLSANDNSASFMHKRHVKHIQLSLITKRLVRSFALVKKPRVTPPPLPNIAWQLAPLIVVNCMRIYPIWQWFPRQFIWWWESSPFTLGSGNLLRKNNGTPTNLRS